MRTLVIFLCCLALIGCQKSTKERLIGTWVAEPSSIDAGKLTDYLRRQPVIAETSIQFQANGTYVASGGGSQTKGNWSSYGNTIQLDAGTAGSKPDLKLDPTTDRLVWHLDYEGTQVQMLLLKKR